MVQICRWKHILCLMYQNLAKLLRQSKYSSVTWWIDNFSILGHYNNGNLPKIITIYQRRYKILSNTSLSFQKLYKDLQNITQLAKFRQSWSHWSTVNLVLEYFSQAARFCATSSNQRLRMLNWIKRIFYRKTINKKVSGWEWTPSSVDRLSLPSCGLWFETRAQHLRFFA